MVILVYQRAKHVKRKTCVDPSPCSLLSPLNGGTTQLKRRPPKWAKNVLSIVSDSCLGAAEGTFLNPKLS